jgi:hypothetical protein
MNLFKLSCSQKVIAIKDKPPGIYGMVNEAMYKLISIPRKPPEYKSSERRLSQILEDATIICCRKIRPREIIADLEINK